MATAQIKTFGATGKVINSSKMMPVGRAREILAALKAQGFNVALTY